MPALQFTPFGDWNRANIATKLLPTTIRRSALYGQEKAVRKLAKIVKAHIASQDLPSLSGPKKKIREDSRHLIDTATYLESIGVWQQGYTYFVGVKSGLIEPSGIEIAKLAYILEVGTRDKRIPARPVWGPSIEEMGGMKGIADIALKVLMAKFKAQGWEIGGL